MIDNNLHPKWVKLFTLDYYRAEKQQVRFKVWDDDDIGDNELIGTAEILLKDIVQAPSKLFSCALVHKKDHRGTLRIKADVVSASNDMLKIHFNGNIVSRKFLCCGCDNPYLLIERARLLTEEEQAERDAEQVANLVPV